MTHVTFDKIQIQGRKRVLCSGGCGRKVTRQKTFWQTINPWNKNAAGAPKTMQEIHNELNDEHRKWAGAAETCGVCARR